MTSRRWLGRRWLDSALLVCAVAATRFTFRSHYLYDIDSVNFALGMGRFAPRVYQPHPPGYFLYICLGRLSNFLFHDANLDLVMLSILASCGTVLVVYRLAFEWFGVRAAQFAGAIFLLSPLVWFHGTVALTYSVEAFFSAVVGLLCWRIYCGRENLVFAAAILLGIAAGIRPSSLLFLVPLFLFSLFHTTRWRLAGIVVLSATLIIWFLPMIAASGGFRPYFGALFSLWGMVPAKETVFNSSPATSIARAFTIVLIYFLAFGAAFSLPWAQYIEKKLPIHARRYSPGCGWLRLLPSHLYFSEVRQQRLSLAALSHRLAHGWGAGLLSGIRMLRGVGHSRLR